MRATQIRKGTVLMYKGGPYRVMEFKHVTPGKGNAVVQTKLRNILSGTQTEIRFMSNENVEEADVSTHKATYMYADDDSSHFMHADTYEQIAISNEMLGDDTFYLQEQMEVDVTLFEGSPVSIALPKSVVLTVVETAPEIKGATVTSSQKPAVMDTGLSMTVPQFIKQGEKIVVSTDDKRYLSRADS